MRRTRGADPLRTPDEAASHVRANYPELMLRVGASQVSFWIEGMGRRGRVLRVAQDGDIKRAATALRVAGNAVAGFDDRLPMAAAYLDALIAGELRALRHDAKLDPSKAVAVAQIDAMLARQARSRV